MIDQLTNQMQIFILETASDIQKAWSIETNTILLKLEADFYLLWKTEINRINCFHLFISYITIEINYPTNYCGVRSLRSTNNSHNQ